MKVRGLRQRTPKAVSKDLTSFKYTPDGTNTPVSHLASLSKGGASHLAVIRLASAWNNKTFTLTPVAEGFSCAVVSAQSSVYSTTTPSVTYAEGESMLASINGVWNAKTAASWTSGHKAICQYFARGNGPWTVLSRAPQYPARFWEIGATRVALKFDPRCFPLPKCSSFSAKLRVWCPSALYSNHSTSNATSFSHNDADNLCFAFSETLPSPATITASSHSIDFGALANRGAATDAAVYSEDYDIWNAGSNNSDLPVYKGSASSHTTRSTAYYSADAAITGDALNALKALLRKPFWLVAGFKPANGFASIQNNTYRHMQNGIIHAAYTSRIELVFTASASAFN